MENTKEIFKDIPGFEGYYQVSDRGNLRSLDRTVVCKNGIERTYKGRVIDGNINKNTGYRQFCLGINGKSRAFTASQMVALTFLDYKLNGNKKVIDHVNGVKTDDRLSNLRIVSNRKNTTTCFRKDRSSLTSKYVGVSWGEHVKKWQAHIQYEGKSVYLGYFHDELKASEAYQDALARIEGGTFNPLDYKPNFVSKFKGISFNKQVKKWVSYTHVNKKYKHVGYFNTEIEAHEALQKFKEKQPLSI